MSPPRWRAGLVVGKFSPLHLGHEALIRHALSQCDDLVVLGYSVPEFLPCDARQRRQWLHERFPQVRSIMLDDATLHARAPGHPPLPGNDAPDSLHQHYLASLLTDVLQLRIDALFGSEPYVHPAAQAIARRQGAPVAGVLFDLHRAQFPICGTQLRRHPHRHRLDMAAPVYRSFVRRVCLLGGESTGKTTLAARLAQHYGTVWAPEYGREHWEARAGQLTRQDLLHIAERQIQREQELLAEAHQFLFCDTSPLTTLCYSVAMFGERPAALVAAAARDYAQVLLCEPDFDFVQDGTRRDDGFRAWQQCWYEAALADAGVRYTRLTGTLDERLATAVGQLGPPEPARHPATL